MAIFDENQQRGEQNKILCPRRIDPHEGCQAHHERSGELSERNVTGRKIDDREHAYGCNADTGGNEA